MNRKLASVGTFALVAATRIAGAEEPTPPATPTDAADAARAHDNGLQLTTLRILKDKNVISKAEFDSAVGDMTDSIGAAKASETSSVVMGKWATTMYGFVEADHIVDTTQSFNDAAGNALVARPGTYAGENGRVMFGVRNSRIGFRLKAPEVDGVRTSAMLEMDFLGTQLPIGTGAGTGSESAFFTNPTFRVRHMNLKIETPVVDILAGQYWQLYGWQSVYHPNTVEIQGVPGQIYSRTPQLRVSKTYKNDDIIFEAAIAAMRPPQRNSEIPEGQAGLRFGLNKWSGVTTAGATGTSIQPLSIAVTGDMRHVRLPNYAASKEGDPNAVTKRMGTAVAVDAFIPVIPATKRQGNALSLNGELSTGYGVSDLYTGLTGGAPAAQPQPTGTPPASPAQDLDTGIAVYDSTGGVHLVQWTSYMAGLQYYLPGVDGKAWVSANYAHLESSNLINGFGAANKVLKASDWFDVNLFADVTPQVRVGLEYANFNDTYADGVHAINHRGQMSAFYLF